MTNDKNDLTKEEKLKKAADLMKELKDLELSDDELDSVSGGSVGDCSGVCCTNVCGYAMAAG